LARGTPPHATGPGIALTETQAPYMQHAFLNRRALPGFPKKKSVGFGPS